MLVLIVFRIDERNLDIGENICVSFSHLNLSHTMKLLFVCEILTK